MIDEMLNNRIIELLQILENIEVALNKIGDNLANNENLTGKKLEIAIKQRKGGKS